MLCLAVSVALQVCSLLYCPARSFIFLSGWVEPSRICSLYFPVCSSISKRILTYSLPVNLSTYLILDRAPNSIRPSNMNIHIAIGLLTYTAVIFRAEILLLLIPLILQALARRYLTLYSVIRLVLFCSLTAIGASLYLMRTRTRLTSVQQHLPSHSTLTSGINGLYGLNSRASTLMSLRAKAPSGG